MVEGIEAEDRKVREVRLAMLASAQFVPASIFPEHFKPEDVEEVDDDGGALPEDAALDLTGVEWMLPGESAQEEVARTMAALAANSAQSVSGEDVAVETGDVVPFDARGEWT